MNAIKIDPTKLLGFRLCGKDEALGLKAGTKDGAKIGNKGGVKLGAKIGEKTGPARA